MFRWSVFGAVLVVCLGSMASGQETKPWWNPFGKSDAAVQPASATSAMPSDVRTSTFFNGGSDNATKSNSKSWKSMFKMPSWNWLQGKNKSGRAKESMFAKAGRNTKKFWNSTVDFLNPFDAPAAKPTLGNQGYQPQVLNQTQKSGDGPLGWLWQERTIEKPPTVNEFLRLPRPKF